MLVQGELSPEDLALGFERVGLARESSTAYALGAVHVTILFGRRFFLRSNTYVGGALVAVSDGANQRIDLSEVAGGSGMFNLDGGAGRSLEDALSKAPLDVLKARRLGTSA